MAEKKKVEREFVEASTGKTGKRPAVVTAANKKSATGKRVAAVILWVLALAAEVCAILMLNGTWYIPEEQKMYWLSGKKTTSAKKTTSSKKKSTAQNDDAAELLGSVLTGLLGGKK